MKIKPLPAKVCGFATGALAALLALYKLNDYDIWLHLATGRYIIAQKVIPTQDVFSFSAAGKPWVNHEWLFGVATYLIHQLLGVNGLVIITAILVALAYWLLWYLIAQEKIASSLGAAVLVWAAVCARGGFIVRPQIFSLLCLAIFFNVLALRKEKYYRWLLPVMILWANIHSACILGIFLGGVFWLEASWFYWREKDASGYEQVKKLFLLLIGLLLVTNINPNTYHVLTYPLKGMSVIREMGVAEWQATPLAGYWPFWVFLGVLTLLLLINWQSARPRDWLLFLPLAYLSIKSVRNTTMFTFLLAPALAYHFNLIGERWGLLKQRWLKNLDWLIISCLVLLVGGVIYQDDFFRFGIGIDENLYPVGAVRFLNKNQLTGPMYNAYRFGGYLIWTGYPQRQVFQDGRTDMYETVWRKIQGQPLAQIVDKLYPVEIVLLRTPRSFAEWQVFNKLYFLSPKQWRLVYRDSLTLLYLRRSARFSRIISTS